MNDYFNFTTPIIRHTGATSSEINDLMTAIAAGFDKLHPIDASLGTIADGTVASPGLKFSNDPDSGLYRIGANNWAASVGGVKVLEISGTSVVIGPNFGIGMTPTNVLDITQTQNAAAKIAIMNADGGNAAVAESYYSNGPNFFEVGLTGTGYTPAASLKASGAYARVSGPGGLTLATATPQPIYLATNDIDRLQVSAAGNVGIGMAPVNVLDITQTQNALSKVGLTNTSAGAGAGAESYYFNGTGFLEVGILGTGYTTAGIFRQAGAYVVTQGAGGITLGTTVAQPIYLCTNSTQRIQIDNGMQVGAPTGGDKGVGTLNAVAVYDDNALLTCMALQPEFLERGEVNTEKWNDLVPNRVHPEQVLIDDEGEVTVVAPERIEVRTHDTARLLDSMVKSGFDPRDPRAYIAKLKADAALPGMPTASEWEANGPPSIGGLQSRMWLSLEMMALVVIALESRLSALEGK